MNQIQNNAITKEAIVGFIDNMEIKKTIIGGYNKVDVFVKIQELLKLYDAYSEQELNRQKDIIEEQQQEIERLKSARIEQDARKEADEKKDRQIRKQREQIADLMHEKDMADGLREKNEKLSEELDVYKEQAIRLQKKVDLLKEEREREGFRQKDVLTEGLQKEKRDVLPGLESLGYTEEIGDILREARKERQSIIDSAHIEVEQETVKILHLRTKYNQEMKAYQNWCRQVEKEKNAIRCYSQQLSDSLTSIMRNTDLINIKEVGNEAKGLE
ncbi:MAG: hypothetical protein ACRC3H_01380 [Lachnospiraceae bacterium]